MATKNEKLESLTLDEIEAISKRYLMGWHDLYEYGFRLKGLNKKRVENGLCELTKEMSNEYRINYIKCHYSVADMISIIDEYLKNNRIADTRWSGIELFDCRFGREYVTIFRALIGSSEFRRISEKRRVEKLTDTQISVYGGVGLASEALLQKSTITNINKFGVDNAMKSDAIKEKLAATNNVKYGGASPFSSEKVREKATQTKMENIENEMLKFHETGIITDAIFKQSPTELIVFYELIKRFGKKDVFYQYGIHPYDARYPFACDFYIKSFDLFIEINAHYSHYNHWYDNSNHDDKLRRQHLLASKSKRSRVSVTTWCEKDVEKRQAAKASNLNYLVFWDGTERQENKKKIPNLKDFYMWFIDYDCDTKRFLLDNPQNTY